MALLPRCACGCGQRVKGRSNRWATPQCIPHAVRVAWVRKGRATYAYRKRRELFGQELDQLHTRLLTREELFAVFMRIYRRGYNSGYCAAKHGRVPVLKESA